MNTTLVHSSQPGLRHAATSLWTSRAFVLAAFTLAAFVIGFAFYPYVTQRLAQAKLPEAVAGFLPEPMPLQAFTLHTPQGYPFGLADLRGRTTLIAAGYTSCPDICPATLSVLREAIAKWQGEFSTAAAPNTADRVQVAFLSVDPARDSPQRLASYIDFFDDRFVGLTGTDEEIRGLARQIGVRYQRQSARQDGGYAVDHTTSIALVDDRARLIALLAMPHDAGRLVSVIERYTSELQ